MTPRSESLTLGEALRRLRGIRDRIEHEVGLRYGTVPQWLRTAASDLTDTVDALAVLESQARRGVHRNPPLVIYGNPAVETLLSRDVHSLCYTHVEDGRDYRHDFEGGVRLWTAVGPSGQRVLRLDHVKRLPLWEDF